MAAVAPKNFAQRLKKLRMERGLTQREFATKTGINYVQYNRYEKGDRKPSADVLPKIADALGVSVDYLLEGDEQNAAVANLADRELLTMFQRTEKLSDNDKDHVKALLDAFIKTREMTTVLHKAS